MSGKEERRERGERGYLLSKKEHPRIASASCISHTDSNPARSAMRTRPLLYPTLMRVGLATQSDTTPEIPRMLDRHTPECASHTRTSLSRDPVTSRWQFGINATARISRVCPDDTLNPCACSSGSLHAFSMCSRSQNTSRQ